MSAKAVYQSVPAIAELIARAQSGDEAALEQIIRDYQRRVAAMVVSLIGDDGEWQDVCQQVFVKMVLGLPQLKEPEVFESWLFRIARNSCFDHLRRRRRWRFMVPWEKWHDSIFPEPDHDAEARSSRLEGAIERLPPGERELVTLIRERRFSYRRLARSTGDSVAAIKSRLFRARRRLRQLMSEGESKDES